MPPSAQPLFGPRGERGYDAAAVETFPWPVVAGYDDVHRWMDQGQAVHAAWQLRDVWEGLIKFLATLAVADHLAAAPADDPRTSPLLAVLLNNRGLSLGHWTELMKIALKGGPLPAARVPQLSPLLFPGAKPGPLFRLFDGDKDSFIPWRNKCFGHGVFRKDLGSYAEDTRHWLGRLHDGFDLCRPLLESLTLESEGPDGEILTWGQQSPLLFYHTHQPPAAGASAPVRVRVRGAESISLSPLLSVQRCDACGQWAAFFFDKYKRDKHRAWFLDFIDGHSTERKNLEPLRRWTELVSEADWAEVEKPPDPAERREPDPERFRDFQHEFEPPVYLARQVADFIRAHDHGVIALTGPGGVGKSWATAGLDHAGMLPAVLGRVVPLLDVSMHGPTAPRASEVWNALAERARRVKRWQVPPWPDGPEPHTRFAAWLAALMWANGLGELLVALDGLDDLPADSDVPDLWPPAGALPQGCYLVLSSRPGVRAAAENGIRRVRSMADHFRELRLGPDEPEHRAVLRSYAAKRLARPRPDGEGPLPAAWAEPLIDQAAGSFLYVFHYCRALHFGVYTALTQLPPPAAYYPAFFEHLRGRVGDDLFEGHYARALALIAVARDPVGLTHLTAWGLERSRLVVILDDLADLLRTRREPWDTETLYTLGHDAIRQFLTEDTTWRTRLAEANRFLAELAVQRFGNDWSSVDPFDPVERYLLFHLLDHATKPELRERLLTDTGLAPACFKHGLALSKKRNWATSLFAFGMALTLWEDHVHRKAHRDLRDDLARALMNRGIALNALGRLDEALADHCGATGLYEQLVCREGRRELCDFLAWTYMNRGIALKGLGRVEEALAEYGIAISRYEDLVNREGRRELRNEMAEAYMTRGIALSTLGRGQEAVADHGAAINLREELVHFENRRELAGGLAQAYLNRGVALKPLGRLEEALVDYGTAISLYEELVNHEGRRHLRNDLAAAYLNRGNGLRKLGRVQKALTDYRAAIGLREELVRREGHQELAGDLARAYAVHANLLLRMGQRDNAGQRAREAVSILQAEVTRTGRADLSRALAFAEKVVRATIQAEETPGVREMSEPKAVAQNESALMEKEIDHPNTD